MLEKQDRSKLKYGKAIEVQRSYDGASADLAKLYMDLGQFTRAAERIDKISDNYHNIRESTREDLAIRQALDGDENAIKTLTRLKSSKRYKNVAGFEAELYAKLAYGKAIKGEDSDKFFNMALYLHGDSDEPEIQARMYGFLGRAAAVLGNDPREMFNLALERIQQSDWPSVQVDEWLRLAYFIDLSGLDASIIYEKAVESLFDILPIEYNGQEIIESHIDQQFAYEDILFSAIGRGYFGYVDKILNDNKLLNLIYPEQLEEWQASFRIALAEAQAHKANSILSKAA